MVANIFLDMLLLPQKIPQLIHHIREFRRRALHLLAERPEFPARVCGSAIIEAPRALRAGPGRSSEGNQGFDVASRAGRLSAGGRLIQRRRRSRSSNGGKDNAWGSSASSLGEDHPGAPSRRQ